MAFAQISGKNTQLITDLKICQQVKFSSYVCLHNQFFYARVTSSYIVSNNFKFSPLPTSFFPNSRSRNDLSLSLSLSLFLLISLSTYRPIDLFMFVSSLYLRLQWRCADWPTGHSSSLTLDIKRVAGGTSVIHSQGIFSQLYAGKCVYNVRIHECFHCTNALCSCVLQLYYRA